MDYWRQNKELRHLTPPGVEWPEGMYFPTYLSQMFEGQVVADFGCGAGRLSVCFEPSFYTGYDINPAAVNMARMTHPVHNFFVWDERENIDSDCVLAHTVLVHVSDEEIDDVLAKMFCRRIVVSEIMDRSMRRPEQTQPPVFNRSLNEYEAILKGHDFELAKFVRLPYDHYINTQLTIAAFERV